MIRVVLCCRICRMTLSTLTNMSGLTELADCAYQVIQVKVRLVSQKLVKMDFKWNNRDFLNPDSHYEYCKYKT